MYAILVRLGSAAAPAGAVRPRAAARSLREGLRGAAEHAYVRPRGDGIEGVVFAAAGSLAEAGELVEAACRRLLTQPALAGWSLTCCEPDVLNVGAAWLPAPGPPPAP
ncbi:hypothetical protein [Streptomyces sp. STR69]|uniref:hypothetical protein n=1 Tax=Streptomyces sp. STR69 TaxID=1796942 RepID=UPI0021C5A2B4|nr:hypothetical protein [Streptomyces sp. STR69]